MNALNLAKALNKREAEMLDALRDALWEIESELEANDAKEVQSNPMLRAKRQFVDRTKKRIAKWLGDDH